MSSGISITPDPVAVDRFAAYGVTVNDYFLNGKRADFETLIVELTTQRAATIESETKPLATLVSKRNKYLKSLQDALGNLTGIQEQFASGDGPDATHGEMKSATVAIVKTLMSKTGGGTIMNPPNKSSLAEYIQLVKSESEKLNNDAQTDTTRLQSLLSKRDDAFSTASTMMGGVSETRGNTIKGMS